MKISIIDASNYFKGLLLLVRKDKDVTEQETALMKRIGKALGFEKEFCDNSIRDILDNKYILDEHPVFSTKELALSFIKDGIAIAFSDKELHPYEEQWLSCTAEKNKIDAERFYKELENKKKMKIFPERLEIENITLE